MKLPNFTHPLFEVGEHNAKEIYIFFLNLDTVLSDLSPEISGRYLKTREMLRCRKLQAFGSQDG